MEECLCQNNPPYNLCDGYDYTTFNNCISVEECCWQQHDNCVTVEECCWQQHDNCIPLDYKPSATLDITTDTQCKEDCVACGDCDTCYGDYEGNPVTCLYLNREFEMLTLNFDLPTRTIFGSGSNDTEICEDAGIKWTITHIESNVSVIIDKVLDPNAPEQDFNAAYTPTSCGLYKIKQEAYNCCMNCDKTVYVYVKDYLPQVSIAIDGLCDTKCNTDGNDTTPTCCDSAFALKPLTLTSQVTIPVDYETVCSTRKVKWKIYSKYPEKVLVYESNFITNLDSQIEFTPLDQNVYIVELHYQGCCDNTIATREFTTDLHIRPIKERCNVYRMASCDIPSQFKYKLYKYDPNTDSKFTLIKTQGSLVGSTSGNNIISVPGDGIYRVDIYDLTIDGNEQDNVSFMIYEFCQVFECIKKLTSRILCIDPCCEDGCESAEERKLRYDMNRIIAMFSTYKALINKELYESKYSVTFDETKLATFAKINDFLEMTLKVCGKCDNGCSDC